MLLLQLQRSRRQGLVDDVAGVQDTYALLWAGHGLGGHGRGLVLPSMMRPEPLAVALALAARGALRPALWPLSPRGPALDVEPVTQRHQLRAEAAQPLL